MKIDLSPAVQRHLEKCPDASIEVLQLKAEADYFARCLLMPEDKVKEFLELVEHVYNKVHVLSKIFAVPKDEMRYRLYELGLINKRITKRRIPGDAWPTRDLIDGA